MLGTTKIYGCLADPIDHVKAPTIFTSIFKEQKVLTLVGPSIKIRAKNGSLACQGDGEIFGAGEIEYSVIKKGLRYLS